MTIRDRLLKLRSDFQALEPVIVDGFATFSPWLGAVFPAALTGWNVSIYLTNDWGPLAYPVAILAAAAVESLGISATHTAIKEWAKGRNTSAGLFRLAIASGLHYLAAVIAVNVVLEAAYVGDWPKIIAKAILSTLSVTGALVIAIRAQGAANDIDRKAEKEERNAKRNNPQPYATQLQVANAPDSQQSQPRQHDDVAIPLQEKPPHGQSQARARALKAQYPTASNKAIAAALQVNEAQISRAFKSKDAQ